MTNTKFYVSIVWVSMCIVVMWLAWSHIALDRMDIHNICERIDDYERNPALFGLGSLGGASSSSPPSVVPPFASSSSNTTTTGKKSSSTLPGYELHIHMGCIIPDSGTLPNNIYHTQCDSIVASLRELHTKSSLPFSTTTATNQHIPTLHFELHSLGIIETKDLPSYHTVDKNNPLSYETILYQASRPHIANIYRQYITNQTLLNSMLHHIPLYLVLDTDSIPPSESMDDSGSTVKNTSSIRMVPSYTLDISSLGFLYTILRRPMIYYNHHHNPSSSSEKKHRYTVAFTESFLSLIYTTVYSITLDSEYIGELYNIFSLIIPLMINSETNTPPFSSSSVQYVDKQGQPLPLSANTKQYLQSYLHLQWLRQQSIDAHTWSITSLITVFDIFLLHGTSTEMETVVKSLPPSTVEYLEEYLPLLYSRLLNYSSSSTAPATSYFNLRYRSGIQGKLFNEELLQFYPYGITAVDENTMPNETDDDNYIFTISDYLFMTSPSFLVESIKPLNTMDTTDSIFYRIQDKVWNYSDPYQPLLTIPSLFPDILRNTRTGLPNTECHLFRNDVRYKDYAELSTPIHARHSFDGTKNDLKRTLYGYLIELTKEWKYVVSDSNKYFSTFSPFESLPCRPEHQYICTATNGRDNKPIYASFYCKASVVPYLSHHVVYIPPAPLYPLFIKTAVPSTTLSSSNVVNQSNTPIHDLPYRWTYNDLHSSLSMQLSSDIQVRKYGVIHLANNFHHYRSKYPDLFLDNNITLPELTIRLISGIRKMIGLPSKSLRSVTFLPDSTSFTSNTTVNRTDESETVEIDSEGNMRTVPSKKDPESLLLLSLSGKYIFQTTVPVPDPSINNSEISSFEKLTFLYRWNHMHRDKIVASLQATCRLAKSESRIQIPYHVYAILQESMDQLLSLPFLINNVSSSINSLNDHIQALQTVSYQVQRIRWFTDSLNTDPYLTVDMYMQPIHQIAVYLPIWAPMILPLCIAFIHSLRRLCKGKLTNANSNPSPENGSSPLPLPEALRFSPSISLSGELFSSKSVFLTGASVQSVEEHNQLLSFMLAKLRQQNTAETLYYCKNDYGIASICQGKGILFIRPYDHQNKDGNDEYDGPSVRSLYAAGQATHTITPTAAAIHLPWLRTVVYGDMKHVPEKYQECIREESSSNLQPPAQRSKQFWVATMDALEFQRCFGITDETMQQSLEFYERLSNHVQRFASNETMTPNNHSHNRSVNYGETYIANDEYFARVRSLMKKCSLPSGFQQPTNDEVQTLAGLRTGCIHLDRFKRVIVGTIAMVPFVPDEEGDDKIIGEALVKLNPQPSTDSLTVPRTEIAELKRMSITPFARRSGIAKVLVNHAEQWTRTFTSYRSIYLSTLRTMVGAPPLYLSCKYSDITRTAWLKGYMFATGGGISTNSNTLVNKDVQEGSEDILPPEVIMYVAEFGKRLE